jgi:hypothetical protein
MQITSLPPEHNPVSQAVPSGFRSSEFWLSLAAVLIGAVAASGLLPAESPWIKVLGLVATVLAALGYTASRGLVKARVTEGAAAIAVAQAERETVVLGRSEPPVLP